MKRTIVPALAICAALLLMAGFVLAKDQPAKSGKTVQAAADWTTAVDISPTLVGYNVDARLVTDPVGQKVYVVWPETHQTKRLYFVTNESGAWGTVQDISSYQIGEYPGPEINLDNDGNVLVASQARMSTGNYEIVFKERKNGTWSPVENVSQTPTGGSQSASILVDRNTNDFYVIWQDDFERPSDDVAYWKGYLRYKIKGEGPWIYSGVIAEETGRCYFHIADMDAQGKAYVAFDNRATGNKAIVQFAQNPTPKDHTTWTRPINVSDFTYLYFSYPKMACDGSGNVYVVWTKQLDNGNIDIFFRKRINGVWTPNENLSDTQTVSYNPTIAVNKLTGQVCVAWAEQSGANSEIYYRESTATGWTDVRNMTKNASYSDYPALYVDLIGGVHLVYSDNLTGNYHVYYMHRAGEGGCFPPLNLTAVSKATAADPRKKTNTLTWEKNPYNGKLTVTNYKIYRKKKDDPDTAYKLLTTLGNNVFQYQDADLLGVQQYTYRATTVVKGNHESEGSTPADDQFISPPFFPPTNLAVMSALGDGIYKKDDTLTWQKNAQNRASEVAKYRIYRKKVEEDDTAYVLAGEVAATVFSFKDVGLVNNQRYSYAAVSYSIYSHESLLSASVTDLAVFATTYPPVSPELSSRLDTTTSTKINTLRWLDNSQNQGLPIKSYRIYRKAESDSSYALAGTVGVETHRFNDFSLETSVKYVYKLTSVPDWDIESGPTSVLSEARVFPPENIVLQTVVNSFLLYQEKVNKLTWVLNALNDPVTVASYKIYRKKTGEDDSAYALVGTAGGASVEYLDRKLPLTDKYVYRITAVDSLGNESNASTGYGES